MKNRYFLSTAILFCLFTTLFANQSKIVNTHYFSDQFDIPNYVAFDQTDLPAVAELDVFLREYWKEDSGFDLRLKDEFEDQMGMLHSKYVQTYQGIDIELAEWIVHSKNGFIHSMNGKLISKSPVQSESNLDENAALQAALNHIGAQTYKWELNQEEAMLKQMMDDPSATYYPKGELAYISPELDLNTEALKLCYKFNIYAHEPMSRQEIYIDLSSSAVVFSNDLIHTSNVPGTAYTGYSGVQTITTDSFAVNRYRLNQTALGNGINTYDLNNATNFGAATDFVDSNNVWNQINAQRNQYATDAHWGAEQTYLYFFNNFNRNSINNNGFALNSYVHYDNNFVNAFWNGQFMTYGDGNAQVTPLTALDIAGHEIAHGLTTFSANLIYARESGALNESFSDIFGTAIEFFARPNRANWTVGEDIGITLRNMANPKQYGDPDTYGGANWLSQIGCVPSNQNDNCGVHINSGVQNYWFHLITDGGTGSNDNFQSYNVPAIGIVKAQAIAYRNLTVYLGRSSDFQEARFYSIQSAVDLYGACSPEVESVTKAWYAVGVGSDYFNGVRAAFASTDSVSCQAPLNVSFFNESDNGITFNWDFGDGSTSTNRNPIHTYTNLGQYDVTLIADGGSCGADTLVKTAYIDLDTNNSCLAFLNNGSNARQIDCTGKLFDSGGSNSDYSNNQVGTLTIAPPNASSVSISFLSFDVEAGSNPSVCDYDFLEVFDGDSTNAVLIGKYCNNNLPPATITSSRGAITLRFRSDGGVVRSGFEIDWNCNYPTTSPTADFTVSMDTSCTGQFSFTDNSSEGPTSWLWDFGDGTTSNAQDPSHTYIQNGNFNVSLIATNSFGSDTITKNSALFVDRPSGPSVQNDTACQGQTSTLTASGNGILRWFDREFGGSPITTGANLNVNQPNGDTTFWVEDFVTGTGGSLGPTFNNIGPGANFNGDQYLIFDVYKTLILTDVFVYAQGNGVRTIELRDNNGNVVQSKTLNISNGLFNVDLDFLIEPGTDYELGVDYSGGNTLNLYRNSSGAQYPYTLPGMLSIKRSSATSNPLAYYYFFYYWRVKEPDCISPRVPVVAAKDPNCGLVGLEDQAAALEQLSIFPNPANDLISVLIPAHNDAMDISLWTLDGKKVKEIYNATSANQERALNVNIDELPAGVYLARVNNQASNRTIRLVIY